MGSALPQPRPTRQHAPARRRAGSRLAAIGIVTSALVLLLALTGGSATSMSATVTVTLAVPSSIDLTNNCTAAPAWNLGTVLPGQNALSDTGPGVCSFTFQSNNDSAMLRMRQLDGVGAALGGDDFSSFSQVDLQPTLRSVDMVNSTTGFAVGDNSKSYETANAGATWTSTATTPGIAQLDDVSAISTTSFLATEAQWGTAKNLYRFTKAGTWSTVTTTPDATCVNLQVIEAVDASNWWAACDTATNMRILRTINGGAGWTTTDLPQRTRAIEDVYSIDATHVWFAGNQRSHFYNAGAWTDNTSISAYLNGIASTGGTGAVAVGRDGWIGTTSDGGATWTQRASGTQLTLTSLVRESNTTFYAFGEDGTALKSIDGGVTWSQQASGTSNTIYDGSLAQAGTVVTVGAGRFEGRTTTGGTTWLVAQAGAPSILSIDMATTDVGWTAGDKGEIQRTTNGTTWTPQVSGTTQVLRGIVAISTSRAVAVGDAGSVVTTTDSGANWSLTNPVATRLNAVAIDGSGLGWAVGSGGVVLRTGDFGATWTTQNAGVANDLRTVSTFDGKTAWIAGDAGTLLKTTDGGATWVAQSDGGSGMIGGVSAVSSQVAWLNSSNGVFRTLDGGTTWTYVTSSWGRSGIDALTSNVAAWLDDHGRITYDGGATWTDAWCPETCASQQPTTRHLAIDLLGTGTAYIAGEDHSIGRTVPASSIADYGAGNLWSSGGAVGLFGFCAQAKSALTVADVPFDAGGTCTASDSDPWQAVPTTATRLGHTANPGDVGRVDVVWGVRPAASQAKGTFRAPVLFEALAPNVAPPPPVPVIVGQSSQTSITGTVVVPRPAGVVSGVLMVAAIMHGDTTAVTPPGGWTLITSTTANDARAYFFSKVAGGAEPASYSFTNSAANGMVGTIQAITGANAVTPVDVFGGAALQVPANTATAPSLSTTSANDLLLGFYVIDAGTRSWTPPAGMTETLDTTSGNVTAETVNQSLPTGGSTGVRAAVYSGTGNQYASSTLIAIRP